MHLKNSGPRGGVPDTAQETTDRRNDTARLRSWQPIRCELHGIQLVHRLPHQCPLSTANPLTTLGLIQDAAWAVIGRGIHDAEQSDANELLDRHTICSRCVVRNIAHRTIRRLRHRAGAAA